MNESTTITIDNIVKLIDGIAKAEYQRGYVAGLEEKRLTEKHWGRKQPEKKNCDNCKYGHGVNTCLLKPITYDGLCGNNFSQWEPYEEDKTE